MSRRVSRRRVSQSCGDSTDVGTQRRTDPTGRYGTVTIRTGR